MGNSEQGKGGVKFEDLIGDIFDVKPTITEGPTDPREKLIGTSVKIVFKNTLGVTRFSGDYPKVGAHNDVYVEIEEGTIVTARYEKIVYPKGYKTPEIWLVFDQTDLGSEKMGIGPRDLDAYISSNWIALETL